MNIFTAQVIFQSVTDAVIFYVYIIHVVVPFSLIWRHLRVVNFSLLVLDSTAIVDRILFLPNTPPPTHTHSSHTLDTHRHAEPQRYTDRHTHRQTDTHTGTDAHRHTQTHIDTHTDTHRHTPPREVYTLSAAHAPCPDPAASHEPQLNPAPSGTSGYLE